MIARHHALVMFVVGAILILLALALAFEPSGAHGLLGL
jgi:hypothetical protein